MQEFHLFVRFGVDPSDLVATVETLLAGHRGNSLVYDPGQVELKRFLPMSWWAPESIVNGHHYVRDEPPIYIWTDVDHSIIYVCKTD